MIRYAHCQKYSEITFVILSLDSATTKDVHLIDPNRQKGHQLRVDKSLT